MRLVKLSLFAAPLLLLFFSQSSFSAPSLPAAEMKAIYKIAGLSERNGKFFAAGYDEPLEIETEVVDLNGDGQPEVFMLIHGTYFGGGAGVHVNLYIKGPDRALETSVRFSRNLQGS